MAETVRTRLEAVTRLMQQGDSAAAERHCREALTVWPEDVNLLAMLGAILASMGVRPDAEHYLRRAIALEPGFARPYADLGMLLLANDAEAALPLLRRSLELAPGHPSVVRALARTLRRVAEIATDQGRYDAAEHALRQVVELLPDRAGPRIDLGRFLQERGRIGDAIAELERAARLAPDDADLSSDLGNLHGMLGHHAEALAAYDSALARRSDHPAALIGRGHSLRIAGRTDEAIASYRQCTRQHPAIGTAWWYLASLHRYALDAGDIRTMQTQLEADDLDAESAAGFHFALARAFESEGRFDTAWRHYMLGNATKRATVDYDPSAFERTNTLIRTQFADAGKRVPSARPIPGPRPIFIVGLPRSGSTLIEQILASHSAVEACGELPVIPRLAADLGATTSGRTHYADVIDRLGTDDLTDLGRRYIREALAGRQSGLPCFTDKLPANFPHLGLIARILPGATFIDARRHPLATCVANFRQLYARGKEHTYDLHELGAYYLEYVRMMSHWDAALPGRVLNVTYEDVVTDLEGQVRRLLAFCDLPFEPACVDFHTNPRPVNTASAEQVREPIYTGSLAFWRNYLPQLDELRTRLAPVL